MFPTSETIYEKSFDLFILMCEHLHVFSGVFLTFIDEKSYYTWITLLPSKDKVLEIFMNFHEYVTNHFKANVKLL